MNGSIVVMKLLVVGQYKRITPINLQKHPLDQIKYLQRNESRRKLMQFIADDTISYPSFIFSVYVPSDNFCVCSFTALLKQIDPRLLVFIVRKNCSQVSTNSFCYVNGMHIVKGAY
ncbi:MAG: hypothetical protein EZS28_039573 [Streblomastix strix]|uniref:Uncharacterized protein n=1 Tax=Streblomastix strix TaxID=222440 RepID=A0A5J4U4J4_9EUKA|nr:MAG: hypothetical protein EZS28_039573 [Streblomastix strix]